MVYFSLGVFVVVAGGVWYSTQILRRIETSITALQAQMGSIHTRITRELQYDRKHQHEANAEVFKALAKVSAEVHAHLASHKAEVQDHLVEHKATVNAEVNRMLEKKYSHEGFGPRVVHLPPADHKVINGGT